MHVNTSALGSRMGKASAARSDTRVSQSVARAWPCLERALEGALQLQQSTALAKSQKTAGSNHAESGKKLYGKIIENGGLELNEKRIVELEDFLETHAPQPPD